MEAGSLDGDSALCSRQAWRLAAWRVILQPAAGCKWRWMEFMDLRAFWGQKVANLCRPVRPDYTGVVALKKPCNLGTSILMTEPGGLQAWRLAASMKWICVHFIDSWGIWCPWVAFLLIPSILYDFKWICMDFMESRGPGSGGI